MKRYGNLYEKICSMENLELAFKNAKKGKGWYKEVQQIEKRPYYYLAGLQWMLKNHKYKTSEYTTFTKKDGKKEREIYKLPFFPDRIAQWAVLQVIEPQLLAFSQMTPIQQYQTKVFMQLSKSCEKQLIQCRKK